MADHVNIAELQRATAARMKAMLEESRARRVAAAIEAGRRGEHVGPLSFEDAIAVFEEVST